MVLRLHLVTRGGTSSLSSVSKFCSEFTEIWLQLYQQTIVAVLFPTCFYLLNVQVCASKQIQQKKKCVQNDNNADIFIWPFHCSSLSWFNCPCFDGVTALQTYFAGLAVGSAGVAVGGLAAGQAVQGVAGGGLKQSLIRALLLRVTRQARDQITHLLLDLT